MEMKMLKCVEYVNKNKDTPIYKVWEEFRIIVGQQALWCQIEKIKVPKCTMAEKAYRRKIEKQALDEKPDKLMTIADYSRQLELMKPSSRRPKKKCEACKKAFTPAYIVSMFCKECHNKRMSARENDSYIQSLEKHVLAQ